MAKIGQPRKGPAASLIRNFLPSAEMEPSSTHRSLAA